MCVQEIYEVRTEVITVFLQLIVHMEMKLDKESILNLHDRRACFKEATADNIYIYGKQKQLPF